jgi:hypothetical protein
MKKNKNFISKMYVWPAFCDEMNLPGKEGLTCMCSEIDQDELAAADQKRLNDLVGKIIVPLQLACESRQYSLMSMALDCFQVHTPLELFCCLLCVFPAHPLRVRQKLLLYGYINGAAVDIEQPDKKLIERVLFVINTGFQKRKGEKTYPDDNVQLQILKVCALAASSRGLCRFSLSLRFVGWLS